MDLLCTESRGEIIENHHYGTICVYSKNGIYKSVGNIDSVCYFRSSSKPIQTIPVLLLGLDKKYGLTDSEIAIIAGSNAGDDICLDTVRSLMSKTGITEEDLILGARYPSSPKAREKAILSGEGEKKIYHGCTPKHIGAMIVQRELTGSINDYYLPDSAAQRIVRYIIAMFSGVPYNKLVIGTDGCGVPVFGAKCDRLARAFYCLANPTPNVIGDKYIASCAQRITHLMNEYPYLVRGENYLCTRLNSYPNIVAKGGSGGVYCFGLKEEGLGIMLKIQDGSESAWQVIIAEILRQISPEINSKLIFDLESSDLTATTRGPITNSRGDVIGHVRPMVFLV